MKTVVIVDDEKDARRLLTEYITMTKKLQIIGEASDGFSAVEIINRLQPDVVFLDIQMPGLDGFQVLASLNYLPQIIFSTAFDQYALKAFEVYAVDYLLKPYSKKRFENSVSRITENNNSALALTENLLSSDQALTNKVILHKGNRQVIVPVNEIIYASAFGDYTKVYTIDVEYLSTKGITELQERLSQRTFIRTHRSHFINLDQIKELRKIDRYYYTIMKGNHKLRVSQTYLPVLRKHMI